jgi:hypothetical protein
MLAAALRAKRGGQPVPDERAVPLDPRESPGGADLPAELAWLVPVAVAFADLTTAAPQRPTPRRESSVSQFPAAQAPVRVR